MKKANWEEVKNLKTKDLYFAVLRRKDNINVNFFVIISIIDNKVLSCNNVSYLSDEYEVFYKVPFSNYYKDN